MTVTYRPETQDDETFVRRLVVETIAGELGARTWPEPMRSQLIDLQYRTRRSVGRSTPGVTTSQILVADGEDAGWLLTADLDDEIRIVEIMVLPPRRNQGVGSEAIDAVLRRAAGTGKPVRLLVNCTNARAIRLYERLGFRTAGTDQVQFLMEWTATSAPALPESAPPQS